MSHPDVLVEGETISLNAAHVAGLALRGIQPKEAFTIADASGRFFRASLKRVADTSGRAIVYEHMAESPESSIHITLFCAVLGRQRMLPVIQKATELGVTRVIPVLSEHAVPADRLAHEKEHAWPKQALRAARQCRRASLPEVLPSRPLRAALEHSAFVDATVRFFLDDRSTGVSLCDDSHGTRIALLVGPEGGWSEGERSLLTDKGALPLKLGGRVLRAETAVYAGLTILQHTYGDMTSGG